MIKQDKTKVFKLPLDMTKYAKLKLSHARKIKIESSFKFEPRDLLELLD